MDHIGPRIAPGAIRRDPRLGKWCWVPNLILDYAAHGVIDALSVAVYVALARHADQWNECWPSIGRLAWMLGVSRDTVRDRLYRLRDARLILIYRRRTRFGDARSHYYILLEPEPLPTDGEEDDADVVRDRDGTIYVLEPGAADDEQTDRPAGDIAGADEHDADTPDEDARVGDGVAGVSEALARVGHATARVSPELPKTARSRKRSENGGTEEVQNRTTPTTTPGDYRKPPERPELLPAGDDADHPRRPDRHEQESYNENNMKQRSKNVDVVKKKQGNISNTFSTPEAFAGMRDWEYVHWAAERFRARLSPSAGQEELRILAPAARALWSKETPEWWDLALEAAAASGAPNAHGVSYAVATAVATNSPPRPWRDRRAGQSD